MTAPVEPDRLYEAAEVAALLGIKRRSLLRAVPRGGWPAPDRRIGGRPAWLGQTVLAGLAARQRPAAGVGQGHRLTRLPGGEHVGGSPLSV